MSLQYNITVIGSGPGGYVAAIRASQLGYKVALIEKYGTLGGTCTNVGCIPSKALLDSSEHYHQAKEQFKAHGIHVNDLELDFQQFIKRKSEVVSQNTSGLNYLMKKNKIDVFHGLGSFVTNECIQVTDSGQNTTLISSSYFIIATGSKPSTIPGVVIDKKRIITSTEGLSLNTRPKSMVIIGGGVIGVELASVYARIGTEVTIIEFMDSLIPTMDRELGKALQKSLTKLNIKILLNSKVQSATNLGEEASVNFIDQAGLAQEIKADYILVAVGRKAYTEGLNFEAVGVEMERGKIKVNGQLQTNTPNIYAIGDVIDGPMLAHKAEDEGTFVAEVINGQKPHINYNLIPGVVYTWPEVASVGATEEQLKAKGVEYRSGKFPYSASARARASMDTDGFVKVLVSPQYGEVLGAHVIGPRAADVIGQSVVAMEYEVTAEDMFRISYAHPTYSEALKDAYLIAGGQGAINI